MKKSSRDSWYQRGLFGSNPSSSSWYSIKHVSPYVFTSKVVDQADVEIYPHKCAGCMRIFKTMKQTQRHCSISCLRLGYNMGGGIIGPPEKVTVGILGPPKQKAVTPTRSVLSSIRDIQDILSEAKV